MQIISDPGEGRILEVLGSLVWIICEKKWAAGQDALSNWSKWPIRSLTSKHIHPFEHDSKVHDDMTWIVSYKCMSGWLVHDCRQRNSFDVIVLERCLRRIFFHSWGSSTHYSWKKGHISRLLDMFQAPESKKRVEFCIRANVIITHSFQWWRCLIIVLHQFTCTSNSTCYYISFPTAQIHRITDRVLQHLWRCRQLTYWFLTFVSCVMDLFLVNFFVRKNNFMNILKLDVMSSWRKSYWWLTLRVHVICADADVQE